MNSYIYLITNGADIKVGVSLNPVKRLKALQTGNPIKLSIAETYEIPENRVYKIEKLCHQAVSKVYQKRSEWFKSASLFDVKCIVENVIEQELNRS